LESDKKLGIEKFLVGSSVLKSRDFAGEIIIFITLNIDHKIIKNQLLFE
jgi:hypothetical protein